MQNCEGSQQTHNVYGSFYCNRSFREIPWWVRFCLWFKKPHVSWDFANNSGDYTAMVLSKTFRGRTYIMKTKTLPYKEKI